MALTPQTTATTYCTPAELFARHDWRTVADLLNDGDGPRPTYATALNDTNLATLLMDASGELESACLVGQRYDPDDLAALLADDGAGAGLLRAVVAHLAFWRLCQRRLPISGNPEAVPGAKQALDALAMLRSGERIFPFQEAGVAGELDSVNPSNPVTNPNVFCTIGYQASRFFGFPAGGGGCNGPQTGGNCGRGC